MKLRFHLTVIFALVCLLVMPAATFAAPALWVVHGPHATVYLLGSVHILPKDRPWTTPQIDQAIQSSRSLWLEVVDADKPELMQPLLAELGTDTQHPLASKLTADQLAKLDQAVKSVGIPQGEKALDNLRPWMAAVSLSVIPMLQAGYDPKSGVEMQLKPQFVAAGKAVNGFETISQQLHFFADLKQPTEVDFLNLTVQQMDGAKARMDQLVNAWYSGDTDTLDKLMEGQFRDRYPELYARLVTERNQAWMPQLKKLIDGQGNTLVVVGAGHLTGPVGLVTLLRKAGYQVDLQ